MTIAVLAVQGAFIEHRKILENLGVSSFEIRNKNDLNKHFDAIILPGGESTVQGKLLRELEMFDDLKEKLKNGLPVFGTCAGMILLADKIENDNKEYFRVMNISIVRNGYGRQLGSFNATGNFNGREIPLVFIRAPYISSIGEGVEVLTVCNGKIVAARQNNMLAAAFHPEVTNDLTVHKYFIENIVKK